MRVLGLLIWLATTSLSAAPLKVDLTSSSNAFSDYQSIPLMFPQSAGKPAVVINYDTSGSMLQRAYQNRGAVGQYDIPGSYCYLTVYGDRAGAIYEPYVFDHTKDYFGYFESGKRYRYDSSTGYEFFIEDAEGQWDGDFLNWLTMRRVDIARKVLVGGKVLRDSMHKRKLINGYYVLEAENNIRDQSSAFSNDPSHYGGECDFKDSLAMRYHTTEPYSEIKNYTSTGGPTGLATDKFPNAIVLDKAQITFTNLSGVRTTYNVRLGVRDEPLGLLQKNQQRMNFGVAVFNFDHNNQPLGDKDSSITYKNEVNGATLYPCYADYLNNPTGPANNYDICLETHVKAPIENSIRVIEEYPLVYGTTPIAEAIYEIWGYASQVNHGRQGNGPQYFDNKSTQPSYQVNPDWDPFYDPVLEKSLPCQSLFVISVNDGRPAKDFDKEDDRDTVRNPGSKLPINKAHGSHFGEDEALDDVAFSTRNTDCRPDATNPNLPGHQQLIHFFVLADLGGEVSSTDVTRVIQEAAMTGGFLDLDNDHKPTPDTLDRLAPGTSDDNFKNYYQYGLNGSNCQPVYEWDNDADCSPDNFFYAQNGEQLNDNLQAALNQISGAIGSGGGTSIPSAAANGDGAIYQAFTKASETQGTGRNLESISWIGDIYAIFIDDAGFLRSDDNGNKILDTSDQRVFSCVEIAGTTKTLRFKLTAPTASVPTQSEILACNSGVFPRSIDDVKKIWTAQKKLTDDATAAGSAGIVGQRSYAASDDKRYIFTGVDSNADGMIDSSEQTDFVDSNLMLTNRFKLLAADLSSAKQLIKFTRGDTSLSPTQFRNRVINTKPYLLGDILNSSPVAVGRPAENLDLLYADRSYANFLKQYYQRRTVVYAGGNDGMLHAFNGGFYDTTNKKMLANPPAATSPPTTNTFDLGKELWAYVPYNALPHLHQLAKPEYSRGMGYHRYLVDGKPRVADVRIFANDATHPNGWGTILIVGMRLGGGEVTVNLPASQGGPVTTRSSYSIFDITDPEQAPKLLLEFSHPELGFTTSIPTVFSTKDPSSTSGAHYYLAIGSGADNNAAGYQEVVSSKKAKVFVLDLHTMQIKQNGGQDYFELASTTNSFVGELAAVDFDRDYSTDSLYFGTTKWVNPLLPTDDPEWSGDLFRMQVGVNSSSELTSLTATNLMDMGHAVTAMPSLAVDAKNNRWISVGTGRMWTLKDSLREPSPNIFYGLKEPRDASGAFTGAAISGTLFDSTNVAVEKNTGILSPASSYSTVMALDKAMINTDATSPAFYAGWKKDLTGDVTGSASQLGGFTIFTSYASDADLCVFKGESTLWALRFTTGTAWKDAVLGEEVVGTKTISRPSVELGKSWYAAPTLHSGFGYGIGSIGVHVGGSDGQGVFEQLNNISGAVDGSLSWGEF
jgi:hypothetical protein